jgi:sulfur carrier protein
MTISIQLNGKQQAFDRQTDIASLLDMLNVPHDSVIVEHNRNVLHRADFEHTVINDGDKIELIRIVGGG